MGERPGTGRNGYVRTDWSRREAIGLGAASLALTACGPAVRGTTHNSGSVKRLVNRGTIFSAGHRPGGALQVVSLTSRSTQFEWLAGEQAFAPLVTSGTERKAGWKPQPGESAPDSLSIHAATQEGLRATLNLTSYDDTGALDWRQSYQNNGAAPIRSIRGINALALEFAQGLGDFRVHCVRRDGDYLREALPLSGHLEIHGGEWNAPHHTGLVIIEAIAHSEFLVIGVRQERGWTLAFDNTGGRTLLAVTIGDMEVNLEPGQRFEAPPIYIGASAGSLDDAINLSLTHLRTRVLPAPLKDAPWVSYDIWSTDGADVERNIHEEIAFAARFGVELFYLDASWYRNSSLRGTGDWGKGLGSYQEDRVKFPRGLRYLSDQVHAAGMKFGLWVGPNVVDVALVPGEIPEQWLAQVDGKPKELSIDGWEHKVVQACLGCSDYAQHLMKELTRLVKEYNLDWIKWDNSGIPGSPAQCTRADHGHAPGDGSAAALVNEYAIFKHLHRTYPQLTLEQCGYGSRLDYGRAAYIRANWCSDTTFPSERVRANAMACATVYPSACNASWIVREDKGFFAYDEIHRIDAGIRSRMIGLFGVGTLNGQMSQRASLYPPKILERLAHNIDLYKQYRHLLAKQVSFPFQPDGTSPEGWQAVQFTDDTGLEAVVICFRGPSTRSDATMPLSRLRMDARYRIRRCDAKTEEVRVGKQLMTSGIGIHLAEADASEVLLLKAEAS